MDDLTQKVVQIMQNTDRFSVLEVTNWYGMKEEDLKTNLFNAPTELLGKTYKIKHYRKIGNCIIPD